MRARRAAGLRRSSHSHPTVAMLSRRPFRNTREWMMKALARVNGGAGRSSGWFVGGVPCDVDGGTGSRILSFKICSSSSSRGTRASKLTSRSSPGPKYVSRSQRPLWTLV